MINYEIENAVREYPGLYSHRSGLVVLMSEPGRGVVIGTDVRYHVGYIGDEWIDEQFVPFEGTITLSNAPIKTTGE